MCFSCTKFHATLEFCLMFCPFQLLSMKYKCDLRDRISNTIKLIWFTLIRNTRTDTSTFNVWYFIMFRILFFPVDFVGVSSWRAVSLRCVFGNAFVKDKSSMDFVHVYNQHIECTTISN